MVLYSSIMATRTPFESRIIKRRCEDLPQSIPSIVNPKDYVDTLAWKGNGTSQSFSSLGFDPGLVFITQWTDSNNFTSVGPRHVYDKNNGAQSALYLNTNDTPQTATTGLTAFQTGGFTLGSADAVNESDEFYTAVCFATPASSSSNTSGSISSTVRANTTSKVSVIDYTGTSGNATVGHGLSITPSLILVKNESSSQDWVVWHKEIANNQYLGLNGEYDFPSTSSTMWNNTSPTTNVFWHQTKCHKTISGFIPAERIVNKKVVRGRTTGCSVLVEKDIETSVQAT